MFTPPVLSTFRKNVVSWFSVGLFATSTVAFGQNSAPMQPAVSSNQQQATNPNGGWKRVGDRQPTDPNVNFGSVPADQRAVSGMPQDDMQVGPPPPQAGDQGYYGPQPNQQLPSQRQPGPYSQQGTPNSYSAYGQNQQNYPPPPPIPSTLTIPQGTYVTVRVNQFLSSDKNQPGDAFSATLTDPVVVNGIVVAEPGQTIGGRVSLVEKHSTSHPARLGIQLTTLTLVDGQQLSISTQLTSRQGGTTPGAVEFGTVAGTTGLGAAIGAAAGWGTGAAIGAGAGALAGLIGIVVTHNHPSVIAPEQVLTFQMQTPVTFSTAVSTAAFRYIQPGEYSQQANASRPAPGPYAAAAPAPYSSYPYYPYPYPYYAYGYPYWGPSFAFYYGRGWYGGHYYYRPYVGYHGGVVVHGGRH